MKNLIRKTYKHTVNLLDGNKKILIAVSTGIDSMVLLEYFLSIKDKLKLDVAVMHVNHGLREQSKEEETYLKSYCQERNIPIHIAYYKGDFSENNARAFRYDFAKELMNEYGYEVLATAHHKSDQAETVLMRIIRGSRLLDLSGIKTKQKFASGWLIRPLLGVHKSELPNVFHFEDETNKGNNYFRNRVRNSYVPTLEKENPQLTNHLVNLSEEVAFANNALLELIKDIPYREIEVFKRYSKEVQYFFVSDYLSSFPDLQLNKGTMRDVLAILNNDKKECERYLKSGYSIFKKGGAWFIKKRSTPLTQIVQNDIM